MGKSNFIFKGEGFTKMNLMCGSASSVLAFSLPASLFTFPTSFSLPASLFTFPTSFSVCVTSTASARNLRPYRYCDRDTRRDPCLGRRRDRDTRRDPCLDRRRTGIFFFVFYRIIKNFHVAVMSHAFVASRTLSLSLTRRRLDALVHTRRTPPPPARPRSRRHARGRPPAARACA